MAARLPPETKTAAPEVRDGGRSRVFFLLPPYSIQVAIGGKNRSVISTRSCSTMKGKSAV